MYEDLTTVQQLIAHDANIDATGQLGNTPPHLAAKNSHIQILSDLIENGADVNAANRDGYTPLYNAIAENKLATTLAIIYYEEAPFSNRYSETTLFARSSN